LGERRASVGPETIVDAGPSTLEVHAAWVLTGGFSLSLAYELSRVFGRTGASVHDSPRYFVTRLLALYVVAAAIIGMLLAGVPGAAWVGLTFSVAFILVSILYYNPRILLERLDGRPGVVDWAEDLLYTGALFVAATMLLYEVLGRSLA
jgi:hypothetical protein